MARNCVRSNGSSQSIRVDFAKHQAREKPLYEMDCNTRCHPMYRNRIHNASKAVTEVSYTSFDTQLFKEFLMRPCRLRDYADIPLGSHYH